MRGERRRSDVLLRRTPARDVGTVRGWLDAAGFRLVSDERDGCMWMFEAVRAE